MKFQTRHERTKKKKQTIVLNVLIGIAIVAILAVGGSILLGDGGPASSPTSNEYPPQEEQQSNSGNQSFKPDSKEPTKKTEDEAVSTKELTPEEKRADKAAEEKKREDEKAVTVKKEDKQDGVYKTPSDETSGPNGSWEPIGTVQEGEHTTSYDKASVDWKEKEIALQYATGLTKETITYWWIGNGGSPQTVKGVVSKAENKDNPYVVTLEWVEGAGWKPTSVERVPGAAEKH